MSADLLRRAAAKIRETAQAATPGPWDRPLNTHNKAAVTALLPDDEPSKWRDRQPPKGEGPERVVVAQVPSWSSGEHLREIGLHDLEHIALWSPDIALFLADWLDGHAREMERNWLRARGVMSVDDDGTYCQFARLILKEES